MIKVLSFPPLSFYANVALSPFFEKSTQKIWCSQKKRLPLHPQNQRAEQREPLSMLIWQSREARRRNQYGARSSVG